MIRTCSANIREDPAKRDNVTKPISCYVLDAPSVYV